MLKEICITPQVFDPNTLTNGTWKDINNLLEVISHSGFIIGLNNKDWNKAVLQRLNFLEPKVKEKLGSTMSILKNRDRIVGQPKENALTGDTEQDWYKVAKNLHNIRNLKTIITTSAYDNTSLPVNHLEDINIYQEFGFSGSIQLLKTSENFRKILDPFLGYSRKVTVIDPYFYPHMQKNRKSLDIISQCFRNKRGHQETGSISINCKWEEDKSDVYLDEWQKVIATYSKKSGHNIELRAWDASESSIKLHDRYIITNQSGLVSAAGTDLDDHQNSEWSIKEYMELDTILSQYRENSSPFTLKCLVDQDKAEMY